MIFLAPVMIGIVTSCSGHLDWGLLLWSLEEPAIPSGTILRVYIKSNINKRWVVGIPEAYRNARNPMDKFEIPLSQLEPFSTKSAAQKRANAFSEFALAYAETLQDGLPIRESPDNNARRVYRLRMGEIIKIMAKIEGVPAVGANGTPLPGAWYEVLTENGSTGYCFSYRLNLFEYSGGPLAVTQIVAAAEEDPELERVLSKTWSPEWYGTMVASHKIDLEDLAQHWHFAPGQDMGIAQIYLPTMDKTFSYTRIRSDGARAWRFEGAPLQMSLRSDTTLAVQYSENGGVLRTLLFVALPVDVADLIAQETVRRESLFNTIYDQGPRFISTNYGALSFSVDGRFTWTGYDLLVINQVILSSALGHGTITMGLFLDPSLQSQYNGAFSLHFDGIGGHDTVVPFMYTLDSQGFRIEYVPPANIEGVTVLRRATARIVLFFRAEQPGGF
ncbi:MAG: SH3 domain-containing protein [Treponema sp.]|nr:SH3 domain-containing protein [Treponema sp.]